MGNGVFRKKNKYVAEGENPDHHAWRQPKLGKKAKGEPKSTQPEATSASSQDHSQWRPTASAAATAIAGPGPLLPPQPVQGGGKPSPNSRGLPAGPVLTVRPGGGGNGSASTAAADDDDEDLAEFGNLANAAAKAWDDLMLQKKSSAGDKDFKALFYLGELKDSVERAAKRAEMLRREASNAQMATSKKQEAIEKLCRGFEDRAITGATAGWKLGDFAIRRNKGLCEISMVHYKEEPPYFEVRMILTGNVVGTEATNLVPMSAPQQAQVRAALREFEQAKKAHEIAEDAANQAGEDLKKQHDALTEQVEMKMMDSTHDREPRAGHGLMSAAMLAGDALPAAPAPGPGGRLAPPGLPDLNLVKKWSAEPPGSRKAPPQPSEAAPSGTQQGSSASYPDMRGLREDLRASGSAVPTSSTIPAETPVATAPTELPTVGAAPVQPHLSSNKPSAPSGFPSLDELNKLEREALARDQEAAARGTYPTVHAGAAREVFLRPGEDASYRRPSKNRASSPEVRAAPAASGAPFSATTANAAGSVGGMAAPPGFPQMPGTNQDVPAGFPRLDPTMNQSGTAHKTQQSHFQSQAQQSKTQADAAQAEAQRQAAAQAEAQRQADMAARAQAEAQAQAQAQQAQQAQQARAQQEAEARARAQPQSDWVMYTTENGEAYYHNERTNETAWTLPVGAVCRNQGAQPGTQAWYAQQRAEQERQAAAQAAANAAAKEAAQNDPWAGLRQQEQEYQQQREQWAQWYQQYSAWYQQAAQAQAQPGMPGGMPGYGTHPGHGAQQQQQQQANPNAGQTTKAPPKGPQPPKLEANFEDHAIYAIKSSVLKEMETMVEQGEPLAKRKKALRVLQIQWHPDKNPEKVDAAKSVFQFIEETKGWFLYDPDGEEDPAG